MSFRLKTILGIALIEILLLSILVLSSLNYLKQSNEDQLIQRANNSARLLATMTADAVVAVDLATLDELVQKTASNPGVIYNRVKHVNGFVLSEHGDPDALNKEFVADQSLTDTQLDQVFDATYPIKIGEEVFGHIELGLSTETYEVLFAQALRHMFIVAGGEILLVGAFGLLLGTMLTRQLSALQKGAQQISKGDWGHKIKVTGRDELAETAHCFNEMSASLKEYASQLEDARARAENKRKRAESILSEAIESVPQGVIISDDQGHIVHINQAFMKLYQLEIEDLAVLKTMQDLSFFDIPDVDANVSKLKNGTHVMHSYTAMSTGGDVRVDTDLTEIMETQERNRQLEHDLLKSHKMEAIGTLAGGIAHEINTPVQFVGDNLRFLGEAGADLLDVLNAWEKLGDKLEAQNLMSEELQNIKKSQEEADLEFLRDELPDAVSQSIDGVKQVSKIVLAMKEFAHPSRRDKAPINLNRIVERAMVVGKNEWKTQAMLEFVVDQNLPEVPGYEGELNQVVLNMIVNAAQAISEHNQSEGMIRISTSVTPDQVHLLIEDNGPGVPDDIKGKIFDPFFTTKDVGKGSGQGLSICHDIIVNKHGGRIDITQSAMGGAAFDLVFPRRLQHTEDSNDQMVASV